MSRKTFLIILISSYIILFILTITHVIYNVCIFSKNSGYKVYIWRILRLVYKKRLSRQIIIIATVVLFFLIINIFIYATTTKRLSNNYSGVSQI